jgi:manganese/zinc/iron transport system substrate-binding protein
MLSEDHQGLLRKKLFVFIGIAVAAAIAGSIALVGSSPSTTSSSGFSDTIRVTTTTNMITDLVQEIGSEHVIVTGIMGPGVDPHLYRASASDVEKLRNSDVIFYNGLNLEGKMGDIFIQMSRDGKPVYAVSENIPQDLLLELNVGGLDPHIWWDATLWMEAARVVADALAEVDADNSESYQSNLDEYLEELQSLHDVSLGRIQGIPEEQRVLVTAHDAFQYFGRAYGMEVMGIQGWSTESEAGIQGIRELADMVAERGIKAIFVETTVSPNTIEALKEAARDRGHEVVIGGQLFSDAIGDTETLEGTFIGAFRYNVDTIANALQ